MNKEHDRLTTKQAARLIGCHPVTLQQWRKRGTGPPFVHDGYWVFYPFDGLIKFAAERHVKSGNVEGGKQ